MKHLAKTRPFRGPDGKALRRRIAEVSYLRLGGVDQWVMIPGESLTNPPLILPHGGPGFSETHFPPLQCAAGEDVHRRHWDQRGSGKSFDKKINRSSMTVEQFIADLDELVQAMRERVVGNRLSSSGTRGALLSESSIPRRGLCRQWTGR